MRPFLAAVVALLLTSPCLAADIPVLPAASEYVHDYANLLDDAAEAEIQELSETVFEETGTPLVVVTIQRVRDYDSHKIERLASSWFDEWGIGTLGEEGGTNRGILLMVAVFDRKARIELGDDWGRRWDQYCQGIMAWDIVPSCKAGDHAEGIRAGAQALARMSRLDPTEDPPRQVLRDGALLAGRFSIFPPKIAILLLFAGIAAVLGGLLTRSDHAPYLVGLGVLLVLIGAFTYVTGLLVLVGLKMSGRSGSRSSYSSGGGGFSGGFSSGGGATGSW